MVIDSFLRGIIMAVWRNSNIKDRSDIAGNRREIHDGQYGNALSGRTPQDTYLKL